MMFNQLKPIEFTMKQKSALSILEGLSSLRESIEYNCGYNKESVQLQFLLDVSFTS